MTTPEPSTRGTVGPGPARAGAGIPLGVCLVAAALMLGPPAAPAQESSRNLFRLGFTANVFVDVSAEDAKASILAWARSILDESQLRVASDPIITNDMDELREALADGRIDAAILGADAYFRIPGDLLARDYIYVNSRPGGIFETYVLLVHRDSGIETLGDLAGADFRFWDHSRTTLAGRWIETRLAERGQVPAARFFGTTTLEPKVMKTVLPVFFRQAEACLITESAYRDMAELNPQLGQQLRVLEASPQIVSSFLCFRAGYSRELRERVETAIEELPLTASGRQILTVFQCDRIEKHPASALASSRELLAAYEALSAGEGPATGGLATGAGRTDTRKGSERP